MKLKGYDQFVTERNITSLKHLFQGDYNQDPVLKKDVKKAEEVFMNDSFLGMFKHNDDDGFYVAYDSRAPKMDRVKQLMDKANSEMEKLELAIDKSAQENPQFYEDDDRLDQIMFFMIGKIKEKK